MDTPVRDLEGTPAAPEGRFVKACDKLDMALQAQRYQRATGVDTSEFVASALRVLDDETLIALARPPEGPDPGA